MLKYFGTDGFRGEAGITLTADHAYLIRQKNRMLHGELIVHCILSQLLVE